MTNCTVFRGVFFTLLASIVSFSHLAFASLEPRPVLVPDSEPDIQLHVVTEQWVPYNFINPQGEVDGRATQKVREVLDAAGIRYEILLFPWARAMKIAQTQPNTMIYSIFRTPERETRFEWACPLLRPVKEHLFRLTSRNDIQLNSLDDAKRYITAMVRGSVAHEYLIARGFKGGVNLDLSADPSSLAKKLLAGRVDFLMTTEFTIYEALRLIDQPYEVVTSALEVRDRSGERACMAFHPNTDSEIINKVRRALAEHNRRYIGP
ncbi:MULTISPECIES: transporter substrate-binding domain-containing protein [unclassified Pseudoalteromonas]|uniref:substrate-binding periplasmic protein n=1 Tax=unclassified Pseudoalteromonas TaxID=194690 RepID=UPI002097FB84|nr:transporter substrate-binding domain-containing protein [Pseudoalteromonas sp. XMcav2-N]MCO7190659.1 transporter substrate-binding domain-containing protein [Pseudoalteromonas sp. XMcav2-N]